MFMLVGAVSYVDESFAEGEWVVVETGFCGHYCGYFGRLRGLCTYGVLL